LGQHLDLRPHSPVHRSSQGHHRRDNDIAIVAEEVLLIDSVFDIVLPVRYSDFDDFFFAFLVPPLRKMLLPLLEVYLELYQSDTAVGAKRRQKSLSDERYRIPELTSTKGSFPAYKPRCSPYRIAQSSIHNL
jgi:hypothetical protein